MIFDQQALENVLRRFVDVNVANHSRGIPRAQIRFDDVDGKRFEMSRTGKMRRDRLQIKVVDGRALARDAVVVHGINPIGRDLHLEDHGPAFTGDALDGDARVSQILGESMIIHPQRDELTKPIGRNLHLSCQLPAASYQRLEAGSWRLAACLCKLLQKPNIALIKELNVFDSVFQNRNSFHTHSEGEAAVLFRIVADESVHVGIDHA